MFGTCDLSRKRAILGSLSALLFGLACATGGAGPAPTPSAASLADVVVTSDADGTVVTLSGLDEPTFTAFQQDDPARVVVDLSGVTPGTAEPQIAVQDGTVDVVSVQAFEDAAGTETTRIELSLETDAAFDVVPVDGAVEIRITPEDTLDTMGAEDGLASTPVADDPWASPFDETPASMDAESDELASDVMGDETSEPLAAAMDDEMSEPLAATMGVETPAIVTPAVEPQEPAPLATLLLGIDLEPADQGGTIALRTDGRVDGFTQFLLESPTRLVVDLPGLVSGMDTASLDVGLAGVDRIRLGQHEDKLRVVFDGEDGADWLAEARSQAGNEGVVFALGSAQLPAAALVASEPEPMMELAETTPAAIDDESAPVEATEAGAETSMAEENAGDEADAWAAEETGDEIETAEMAEDADSGTTARVQGIELDRQGDRDRLAVLADGPLDYSVVRPDAETLIVRLVPATLIEGAPSRVVPETPGPVSLVTAFEQPGSGIPEVRVVVRRASGLEPSVMQQGEHLILDFMRGQDVAATPPALTGEASPAGESMPAAIDTDGDSLQILEEGGLVDGKVYTGRRVSLDFKDVDIDDVLRLVAEVSDLNIIAGDEVAGQVTIRLVDVPWDQALDVILLTKGLGFVRVGNVLRIAPSEQLKAEEEGRLQERRAKEKLEDLLVKLQPVNYASVKEVEKMVKRLLTPRGSVDVDERTNTVILKDIASVLDEATALIKAIDTQTPQVLIEAKIVEANLDFSKEIGSTWAFGTQPLNDGFNDQSGNRQDLTAGGPDTVQFHNNPLLTGFTETFNHVSVDNPITSLPTGLLDLGAFILDQKFNVELRLEAAESHGEGKVISSPRIVTLDNRKASIEQGISIPFQTFENGDAKLEFIDAVLRLEVTPHITADRSIIMKIEVQRNAPDDSVQTPTGSPAIAKNEAETETLVQDGQTLVIGGIYTIEKSERESRVPYFHKIPVLGNAFKNHEVRDIRKELLVFVTPRIVVNPGTGA